MDEFEFIAKLLAPLAKKEKGSLALKDDAALLALPKDKELVVTKDAICEGVHFIGDEPPGLIARKLLRVNLSDLAAMGAKPKGYFLALMLPATVDDRWLAAFVAGLKADQKRYGITLMGGDTTRAKGLLTLSVTALGTVPRGKALLRSGARAGDAVYVSGTVGDGALGLAVARGQLPGISENARDFLLDRYRLPQPRLALGQALRGIATACIDVSDGLMQDLGHICKASGCAAEISLPDVPLSPAAKAALVHATHLQETIITGGDDYELLFTVPPKAERKLLAAARFSRTPVTRIGEMRKGKGVIVVDGQGTWIIPSREGYRHF